MNWYTWLLVMYVCLLSYYFLSTRVDDRKLEWWNRIDPPMHHFDSVQSCQTDSDCPKHHLCHAGECIPKALRSGSCNPATGDWVLQQDRRGRKTLTCVCRKPHLITQKIKGGNCNLDLACTPNGRIADWTKADACECDEGYESVAGRLECRPLTAVQRRNLLPCQPDEDEWKKALLYDFQKYRIPHLDKRCLKKLCTFDVLTGRPFKNAEYSPTSGCLCDPTLGRFGVKLDSDFSTLKHYNGCASIFAREPEQEVEVEVHAYFYLLDGSTNDSKPVVSFLVFKGLDQDEVNPIFREAVIQSNGVLIVEQDWPHDFMQYIIESGKPYVVHSRKCHVGVFSIHCNEWVMKKNSMKRCRDIGHGLDSTKPDRANAYHLLYAYPVCRIADDDYKVDAVYRGKYVSNPYHALYTGFPELMRSNGLIMKKDMGKWLIDHAEPYNMDYLMRNSSRVPDVWDINATAFAENKLSVPHQSGGRGVLGSVIV